MKKISILSPSSCDATSIKYLELKLISRSWSNFTVKLSFPSPLFVLLTDKFRTSFDKLNLTPSFLSNETDASVSLDKKDGVKFNLSKDVLNLSVNNTNSGDGKESLTVKFDHDLEISFNSRYLIDVASQLDGDKIEIFFNDTGSPALIKDPGDFDSIFVVMPMKG